MITRLLLAVLTLFLAGCLNNTTDPLVTTDLTYSNAGGFGTQNAGDYRPGSMFVWNTRTGEMQFVDTLALGRVDSEKWPGTRTSNRVAGVGITGLPAELAGSEGLVSASIAGQSSFKVTDGFREDYNKVLTALSDYVGQMIDEGDDPDLLFNPRDRASRVVVIRSILRAKASQIAIGGTDVSNPNQVAKIALNSPVGEIASISVRAGTSTACQAAANSTVENQPICFFSVVVYRPTYVENNPKLQWENASFPRDGLPAAFRSIR